VATRNYVKVIIIIVILNTIFLGQSFNVVLEEIFTCQQLQAHNFLHQKVVDAHNLSIPVLTFPIGGETLTGTVNITWQAATCNQGHFVTYEVHYSGNNFAKGYYVFATNLTMTSFTWDTTWVSDTTTGQIRIEANCSEGKINSCTSGYFAINNGHSLSDPTIIYPSGGETLSGTINITWTAAVDNLGHSITYTIWYSDVDGDVFIELTSDLTSLNYQWDTTTVEDTSNAVILVDAHCEGGLVSWDISNSFSIENNHVLSVPTIISPNGGEILTGTVPIQWMASTDSLAHAVTYTLYQSSDNGVTWTMLESGLTTTIYEWDTTTVNDGSTYLIKVKVSCSEGLWQEDTSDGSFTIDNKAVTINRILPRTNLSVSQYLDNVLMNSFNTTVLSLNKTHWFVRCDYSITSIIESPFNSIVSRDSANHSYETTNYWDWHGNPSSWFDFWIDTTGFADNYQFTVGSYVATVSADTIYMAALDQELSAWKITINVGIPISIWYATDTGLFLCMKEDYTVSINWYNLTKAEIAFLPDSYRGPYINKISSMNDSILTSDSLISFEFTSPYGIDIIYYHWDNNPDTTISSASFVINLPSSDGFHDLYVIPEDNLGYSLLYHFTFCTDDILPSIRLTSSLNGSVHVSGTMIEIDVTDIHLDNVFYHWDTGSNQTWLFPYTTTLPSGDEQHFLHVYANDTAGNSLYQKFAFTTDDTNPSMSLLYSLNESVLTSGSMLEVSILDIHLTTILFNWDNNPNQTWASPYNTYLPVGDGIHSLHIYGNDSAGNLEHAKFVFTTDDTAPNINLITPLNKTIHSSGTITEIDVTDVHLNNVFYHWDTGFNQTWLFPYTTTLPSGDEQHFLHVYANDTAGNMVYYKFVFITDDTIPIISLEFPLNDSSQNSGLSVDIAVISNYLDTVLYHWDTDANRTWETPYQTIIPKGDGLHTLYVYAKNTAGSLSSAKFVFRTDDTAPVITLITPNNMSIHQSGVPIKLSFSDASEFSQLLYKWDSGASTLLFFPYSVELPNGDGQHFLSINAQDVVGNWGTTVLVFITDDTSPTIDQPSNITYIEGESGNMITWNPFDDHPSLYTIYKDDFIIEEGFWTGQSISIDIDGLEAGEYTFKLLVFDIADNSHWNEVRVKVNTPKRGSFPFLIGLITILCLTSIQRKRKTKEKY